MRTNFQFILILFTSVFISCSNNAQTVNASPDDFAKGIQQKTAQLLDTRTAEEFNSNHIEGAMQSDWLNNAEFSSRTSHLDKNRPVYVYCQTGVRASQAANYLYKNGFKEVINLKGGLSAWKKSGKPIISSGEVKPETTAAEFKSLTGSADLVIIDFTAEWCPPCKTMVPVLEEFQKEQGEKVKLIKMDGGNEIDLMKSLKVDALPYFIMYKKGVEAKRKPGVMTKEELTAWVN